jgi:hypothetical protein
MRYIPSGRAGIRVGQLWYCSVDCFAMAARTPLVEVSNRRLMEMPRIPRLSLGLAMLSKGYLTAEQLRTAVAESQWRGEKLEKTLTRLGLASEKQLTAARAAQWGYPVLAQEHIGHLVTVDIPLALLKYCSAVPLHYSVASKRILLGFAYRVEHSFLESIEQMTGCRPEPCFITPTDFVEQMERITTAPDYEEVVVDESDTPERMARTLGRHAVQIAATEAGFTRCKNHIWVRLSGKRGKTDVIFRLKNATQAAGSGNSDVLEEIAASLG